MGEFAIKPITQAIAWLVTAILIYLNIKMVSEQAIDYFNNPSAQWVWKLLIIAAGLIFAGLLLTAFFYPLIKNKLRSTPFHMHPDAATLQQLVMPVYNKIAVALEFSDNDGKLLSHAIAQGHQRSSYFLIHIVESASAKILGRETADIETLKDQERLDFYIQQLQEKGFEASGQLGFRDRAKEIARLVKDSKADILVIGAHGHSGIKDWIYGETINAVRHELKIPVLVVNV